jgi:predicted alpha/beta-hydrolase family hydrolase
VRRLPGQGRGPPLKPRLLDVDTPVGTARVELTAPRSPSGLLVLGHGAGGRIDAPDLVAVRDAFTTATPPWAVALVLQPYRVAGRRAPAPARHLDAAWATVVAALRKRPSLRHLPILTGGRSSGARVACRTATQTGAAGILALAFPLHPPGRPERSRAAELGVGVPLLVVQGARDPFGTAAEFPPGTDVREVPGATHALDADPVAVGRLALAWAQRIGGPRESTP